MNNKISANKSHLKEKAKSLKSIEADNFFIFV